MSSTRKKLIDLLASGRNEFISGQFMSEKLNVSRSAIWKHMNELKKDGYEIKSVANKGYKIVSLPNTVSENTLSWGLNTKWIAQSIVHRESVATTQRIAHEQALNGAAHGTIVVADEQTESVGRAEKEWISHKNKGIWMSIILRPNILPYLAPQLTLLTATVLAEVLSDHYNIEPQIKWPNDILINNKKVSGILTEMKAEQDFVQYVIIGIGMNVNQTAEDFKGNSLMRATSLRNETSEKWKLVPLIQQILRTFERKHDTYLIDGFNPVKREWENYGFKLNEYLNIKSGKTSWRALFRGIGEDGALLAELEDGTIKRIYSGEIAWF